MRADTMVSMYWQTDMDWVILLFEVEQAEDFDKQLVMLFCREFVSESPSLLTYSLCSQQGCLGVNVKTDKAPIVRPQIPGPKSSGCLVWNAERIRQTLPNVSVLLGLVMLSFKTVYLFSWLKQRSDDILGATHAFEWFHRGSVTFPQTFLKELARF